MSVKDWSDAALFDEWWNLVSGDLCSAVADKIMLSRHYGLPVEGFGETPGITFDPMGGIESETFINYKLLEEVFTRVCKFPSEDMGRYMGVVPSVEHRAHIQWSLMVMYNLGFRAALDAVKKMEAK